MVKNKKSAIQFYKEIEEKKELSKHKLINGLFIVKYIDKDICIYVGDFLKRESVLNSKKTNVVLITKNPNPQKFNKKQKRTTNSLGIWKDLDIGFIEKPIKEILK